MAFALAKAIFYLCSPTVEMVSSQHVDRESTKDAMLRIAMETIDESGEAGIRLDAILEAVGVSPSSLYHHYGNLSGLIEAAHIERFRRYVLSNAIELKAGIEASSSAKDFRNLVDSLMAVYFDNSRSLARMQRSHAFGSAYGRAEFLHKIGLAQKEALDIGASAIDLAKEKGFVRADLDSRAFIALFDSQSFGRVLVEATGEAQLGADWNALALSTVHFLLFGEGLSK